jgi:DNA repair protein RadC
MKGDRSAMSRRSRRTEIPEQDRPCVTLLANGAAALTDQELMAVLLGKGSPRMDVMTLL